MSKVISLSCLKMVGQNTLYGVQRNLLIPAVNETYEKTTAARDEVTVLFDARFDSPVFCAKYGTSSAQYLIFSKHRKEENRHHLNWNG